MKAISVKNLSKTYWFYEKQAGLSGSLRALFRGKKIFVEAVRKINMDINVGEIVGFIGPNGAGKTTTLKMLSGILFPTEGDVAVMGFTPFKRNKAFLNFLSTARDDPGLSGVERYQFPLYCSLKQIDQPMAIKARLVHAREKASGATPIIGKLNRAPMTANKKANAERPISTLVIYCIAYLLSLVGS